MSAGDQVRMPQLGESIVEATLVRWCVKVGQSVQSGQILAEIETDKASNEIPSPGDGTVGALLIAEGQTVDVGTPILTFAQGASAANTGSSEPAKPQPRAQPASVKTAPDRSSRLPSQHLAPRPSGPQRSSPSVRRLARRFGVDIHSIAGTGKGGRVTRHDMLRAIETSTRSGTKTGTQTAPNSAPPSAFRAPRYKPQPQDEVRPFSRRRAQIAGHMLYSLGTSAHVATVAEIDVSQVQHARKKDAARAQGTKLTFLPYVVHATVKALGEFPELNATVAEQSLILRAQRNIGIAVDTPQGLIVPVVHRADELGLLGLARAIDRLSQKAREGSLEASDISGGSFTISNPGKQGNLFGVSIIRQPEVGILRIGQVVKRPVVRTLDGEDAIVIRPIMYAALSYDHRVIDGRTGNGFLNRFAELLSGPQPAL